MNILQLPDEMLRMILAYVSDQLSIDRVCKRFYSISSSLKSFHISIDTYEKGWKRWKLEDDGILESILCSKKKISSITITGREMYSDRLKKVLEVVGGNVKEAMILSMPSSIKGLQLLNLMPNLQQLEITVHKVVANVPVDFKLQLGELKHLNGENENLSRFLRPESLGFSRGNVRDLRSSSR
jgi:hypothetical protein